jgi:hypothetical protein
MGELRSSARGVLKSPFFNRGRFERHVLAMLLFFQVRDQEEKLFFYHAPYVASHVEVREITGTMLSQKQSNMENEFRNRHALCIILA